MPAKSLKERALFYAHGFNPALRLFLNPTIIMHIICYLKNSGRVDVKGVGVKGVGALVGATLPRLL